VALLRLTVLSDNESHRAETANDPAVSATQAVVH